MPNAESLCAHRVCVRVSQSSVVHPLLQLVPQLHERRMKRFKVDVCKQTACLLCHCVWGGSSVNSQSCCTRCSSQNKPHVKSGSLRTSVSQSGVTPRKKNLFPFPFVWSFYLKLGAVRKAGVIFPSQ